MLALASSSKRSQGPAEHGVDRLSSLPDPLLHLVMSFLPMPEVMHTSLLSPRWRFLWASMPFIHLDYKDFVDEDDDDDGDEDDDDDNGDEDDDDDDHNDVDDDDDDYAYWEKVDRNRLQKFGDHLLLMRDATLPLDEARIFIGGDLYDECCTWIHYAIRHKARLLHVSAPFTGVIFDHRSMIPSQHLKRMRLQTVALTHASFRPLNFDFPVLEHLELENCDVWGSSATLKISSRSLKTIRMSCCRFNGDLQICALNLNHLSILDSTFRRSEGHVIETRDLYSSYSFNKSTIWCPPWQSRQNMESRYARRPFTCYSLGVGCTITREAHAREGFANMPSVQEPHKPCVGRMVHGFQLRSATFHPSALA